MSSSKIFLVQWIVGIKESLKPNFKYLTFFPILKEQWEIGFFMSFPKVLPGCHMQNSKQTQEKKK